MFVYIFCLKCNNNCHCLFSSEISAWIEDKNIRPYVEHREELLKTCKLASFKDAVKRIEEYILDPVVSTNYQVELCI